MSFPYSSSRSSILEGYELLVLSFMQWIAEGKYLDVNSPARIVLPPQLNDGAVEEDQATIELRDLCLYLGSFGQFLVTKEGGLSPIKSPNIDLTIFSANGLLYLHSGEASALLNIIFLRSKGLRVIPMNKCLPAIVALLNSTTIGVCIIHSVPASLSLAEQIMAGLRTFVAKGGLLAGGGEDYVRLCRSLFASKWTPLPALEATKKKYPLAKWILRSCLFGDALLIDETLTYTFNLSTMALRDVPEHQCIYAVDSVPLIFNNPLELLISKYRPSERLCGFALAKYVKGAYLCYGGENAVFDSDDIRDALLAIINAAHLLSDRSELKVVTKIKKLLKTSINRTKANHNSSGTESEDEEDDEDCTLEAALCPPHNILQTIAVKEEALQSDARKEDTSGNIFEWLCRRFISYLIFPSSFLTFGLTL